MNEARRILMGCGTQTSALAFGGFADPGVGYRAVTESWNGTSWTEVADLNTFRGNGGGVGTSNTAALAFGGFRDPPPGPIDSTELWNGSSWTEVNNMTLANNSMGGAGTTTAALSFGGNSPTTITQSWNGTNWSNETRYKYRKIATFWCRNFNFSFSFWW
jgi:hypothetical protein